MRAALPGLGLGDCGADPCTWFDQIYIRDACLSYLECANPEDPRVVGVQKGLLPAIGQEAGNVIGQTLGSTASSFGGSTGIPTSFLVVGGYVVVAVLLFAIIKSR